ncbi:MAG TPA: ATP-binding protein [Rhodanobacteraceae bacterium]
MNTLPHSTRFALKPATASGAVALLLLVGALATIYQFDAARAEHRRQLTVQANILAASVTAAIAFNDRPTAQEYVNALLLDPRLNAVSIYNESHQQIAGFHRPGSEPIPDLLAHGGRLPRADRLLVAVPARQGTTLVGHVYLRAEETPITVRLARFSGVGLLTIMGALMLSALAVGQRALTRANAALHKRAAELAQANERITAEMEQRSRAEEALRQSQKMEAVGQLSGGIAHDFNNLLMIIKSSLTLFHKKLAQNDPALAQLREAMRERIALGPNQNAADILPLLERHLEILDQRDARHRQIKHYLDTAHDGIEKAASLTRRLLSFARRQPLTPKSLNLDDLVRSMRPLLDHSVGSNVEIEYKLDSHWHVLCDGNQMENAILNLAINARDAMPDGGRISLRTRDVRVDAEHPLENLPPGDYVHLRMADTGTGMSDEVRSKAFDPFFTTKPVGKGTGLGLSTILGYVLQSNGHASIESEVGKGTTINIIMPRAADAAAPEVA